MSREPPEVGTADHELINAATQVIDENGDGEVVTLSASLPGDTARGRRTFQA